MAKDFLQHLPEAFVKGVVAGGAIFVTGVAADGLRSETALAVASSPAGNVLRVDSPVGVADLFAAMGEGRDHGDDKKHPPEPPKPRPTDAPRPKPTSPPPPTATPKTERPAPTAIPSTPVVVKPAPRAAVVPPPAPRAEQRSSSPSRPKASATQVSERIAQWYIDGCQKVSGPLSELVSWYRANISTVRFYGVTPEDRFRSDRQVADDAPDESIPGLEQDTFEKSCLPEVLTQPTTPSGEWNVQAIADTSPEVAQMSDEPMPDEMEIADGKEAAIVTPDGAPDDEGIVAGQGEPVASVAAPSPTAGAVVQVTATEAIVQADPTVTPVIEVRSAPTVLTLTRAAAVPTLRVATPVPVPTLVANFGNRDPRGFPTAGEVVARSTPSSEEVNVALFVLGGLGLTGVALALRRRSGQR